MAGSFNFSKLGTQIGDFAGRAGGSIVDGLGEATGLSGPLARLGGLLKGGKTEAPKPQPTPSMTKDKRLKIKIPKDYLGGPSNYLLRLAGGGNHAPVLFPYTPQIVVQTRANYNAIQPTHSNYAFHAYQNSALDNITIVGTFTAQNEDEARYVLGSIHALRSATKMHFGGGTNAGAPPIVCLLSGFGDYMFNDMPIVISSFFFTLNEDVDYINVTPQGGYPGETQCPTRAEFTVECLPAYSRIDQASFDLDSYINGSLNARGVI